MHVRAVRVPGLASGWALDPGQRNPADHIKKGRTMFSSFSVAFRTIPVSEQCRSMLVVSIV